MAQPNMYEAQDFIQKAIAYVVHERKQDLINLLRKNGAKVEDSVSDKDLIRMTYLGIAKSKQFKKDFAQYLENVKNEGQDSASYVGLVNEKKQAKIKARITEDNPQGKTKGGLLLQSLASKENIQSVLNFGLDTLSKKLTAKADQKSIAQATELESTKTDSALAQAQASDKKAQALKTWILPVVIGAVVLGGIGLFFYMKKRKK